MANNVSLEIITPSKQFYKGECELVIVTTVEGEEGFMAGHAWACKVLDAGGLWIREPGSKKFKAAAVAPGFVDVKDTITIFTDAAEWRADIDVEKAKDTKARAEAWLASDVEKSEREIAIAHNAIKKAENRIKMSEGSNRTK